MDVYGRVTCVNYGPYDNGHILVGLDDGQLLAFDYPSLDSLESVQIFEDEPISVITFDPTNYIFVGGKNGKVVALSYVDRKMHYLYMDLGKNKYCTVQVPRTVQPTPEKRRAGHDHLEGQTSFCCV